LPSFNKDVDGGGSVVVYDKTVKVDLLMPSTS